MDAIFFVDKSGSLRLCAKQFFWFSRDPDDRVNPVIVGMVDMRDGNGVVPMCGGNMGYKTEVFVEVPEWLWLI